MVSRYARWGAVAGHCVIFNWRRTRGNALPWKTPRVNKHLPTAYLLSKGLEWDTAPPAEVEMDAELQGSQSHSSLLIFPCGTSIKHYKKPHFFQIGSFQKGSSSLLLPLCCFFHTLTSLCVGHFWAVKEIVPSHGVPLGNKNGEVFSMAPSGCIQLGVQ